jgi:hypothetical protein
MPAIIRNHVNFVAKADDDALFKSSELTTAEAAEVAGVTVERIRQLVESHKVGRWIERLRCYAIDRTKLTAALASTKRRRRYRRRRVEQCKSQPLR